MGSRRSVFYAYTYESSTQDAPALRTRDIGLTFMTGQLSPHIQCHTMHNDPHFIVSYIP